MNDKNRKRVTIKPKHPNPLFERWLTEWRDKAKENESKMQYCFSTALKSLRKYPLPLETGKDCKILNGFGKKLCKMLDDKLTQYKAENGRGNVVQPTISVKATTSKSTRSPVITPSKNSSKEYVPQYGSGAFAILVALYEKSLEPGYPGYLTKNEIIAHGQRFCNVSFTKPQPDTRYTGWSSMKTLLEKKLVNKQGNPAKFSLTDAGVVLGDKLHIQHKIEEFQNQESKEIDKSMPSSLGACDTKIIKDVSLPKKNCPIWRQASTSSTLSSTNHETIILAPNSFEIILLVDTQELNGSKADAENDPILKEMKNLNVHYEVRNLKVGDYVWICRDTISGTELVLPYIVERKRMDDFGQSIKDDRFHEQKFRLKQCGLQNLIYLIESYGKNEHVGLPITTLYQASTNTLIQDGFSVKFTENGKASCEYLACITNFLEKLFKTKTLVSCQKEDLQQLPLDDDLVQLMHFTDFNKSSSKMRNFRVKDMFIKQLLQIKGMSVDKALAIVEKYPTPKLLKLSYNETTKDQGEKMLSTVQYGTLKKNVGVVLSKIVYQMFCNSSY